MQDRLQFTHQGHAVVAADVGGTPTAAVYRGPGVMLERVEGATLDAAVAAAVEWIDTRRAAFESARAVVGGTAVASEEEFGEALDILTLTAAEEAMLGAHAAASEHRISAVDLARAAGYGSHVDANLQYGLLARRVAEFLDLSPVATRPDGSRIWTTVLAAGEGDDPEGGAYVWRMHPPLAEALRARGTA